MPDDVSSRGPGPSHKPPGKPEPSAGDEVPVEPPPVERDWRAVIVACAGLGVVAVVAIVGFAVAPGSVPAGEVSTKGENIVAICAAAFTAVGTVLAAYFGIKAANLAREDSNAAGERARIEATALAGAEPKQAGEAMKEATNQIRARGLGPRR
jgi:hypothetical protein